MRTLEMIVFITAADTEILTIREAARGLPDGFPLVRPYLSNRLQTEQEIDGLLAEVGAKARIFVVRVLGGRPYFERGFARLQTFCNKQIPLLALPGDQHPDPELAILSNVRVTELTTAFEYLVAGGIENYRNLFLYLADVYLAGSYGFEPPATVPVEGLYHPHAADRLACATMELDEFQQSYWQEGRPAVGVLFYRAHWLSGNLAAVDALIRRLEDLGCNTLPVFCYSLRDESLPINGVPNVFLRYFSRSGKATVDCIISTLSYGMANLLREERVTIAAGTAIDYMKALGLPIIQAVSTSLTENEWRKSRSGIRPLDAAMNVVLPEFDGRIIGPVFSFKEPTYDEPLGSKGVAHRSVSEPQRLSALASLAWRYARLRHLPNSQKRICIMLTNFANKQGRVGSAVGLDTPASAIALLHALAKRGYKVGQIPPNGDVLMKKLLACGGYDQDFLTEDQMQRAIARYTARDYEKWFSLFPDQNQKEMCQTWGDPPGDVYRCGDEIYVAGLQLGNVFLMIQPPRGFGENPLTVYHSSDLIPTHQYLGAYRWIRDVFQADAVIHLGKHGTLEWLPGKALGLSESCYPELTLCDLPVFYPFIINDPGEGTQAKRRIHACIIDHLIPPMTQAETYDDLAKLQQLLTAYTAAERIDPEKLPLIMQEIWDVVVAANLHHDLKVNTKPPKEEFPEFIQHIDGYLCEIGDLQIRDGLHVLGQMPTGEQLINLALALVRLDTDGIMGLRRAIAEDTGLNYEKILNIESLGEPWKSSHPEHSSFKKYLPEGTSLRSHGDILKAIEFLSRLLVKSLAESDFDSDKVSYVVREFELPVDGKTAATLRYLSNEIVPKLRCTGEEITNLLDGLEGKYIPPGPSGAPTRGMSNILPTGRNFYSVDVRAIPSLFAWKVGQRLGDKLLQCYLEKEGRYPQTIGMTIWGTSNMRTQGDDVAEILWLLGVSPVWHQESRRVIDLSIIPLPELNRPRIDVTVRMSGFFRDAFPDVVKMLDRAINMVADLDEPEDLNFVRRNVLAEESVRLARREAPDTARVRSRFRLFSNKAGAYGTGILAAINGGNWQTAEDLSRIYLEWSGYAYTSSLYGEPAHQEFCSRLALADVAVQNQDNREHDIFDSDDYLQFHGGMIAAIRSLKGRAPVASFGDSSNPQRVQVRDLKEETYRIFRGRVANPRWIRSVQRHGYKGALEMAATLDYLFGYDATAKVMEDWMYEQLTEKYIFDETNRAFLEKSNPWALREMTARLLEAIDRGMWADPSDGTVNRLRRIYLATEGNLEATGG